MSHARDLESTRNLIDELLAEQQQLTAVERFSRKHEQHELPAQARYYRSLIPLTKPGPGEQYAFAVDLDVCTACKACVSACHSLNGLDDDEIWRNVGTIYGGTPSEPYQQTVTTACHHCVEPGCLEGCPVMAYEKDEATGIVRHLDDQCIGCEYCLLKCPYDVPKYSSRRGIVRKCDMCYHRLAADEAPMCVQACPNEAITIRLVEKSAAIASATPGARLLPGAFESHYTKPTTLYRTRKEFPRNATPADIHHLRLEHPHWPLIWMLLLTQLSAGLTLAVAIAAFLPGFAIVRGPLSIAAFVALQAGLAVSVLHLGHPLKAWRFFLGLRTSWMSREILAFGMFAGASAAAMAGCAWPPLAPYAPILAISSALAGSGAVFCSAMIYVDTCRPSWIGSITFPKFFGTALTLGLSATAAIVAWTPGSLGLGSALLCGAALYGSGLHAIVEAIQFIRSLRDETRPAHRSAQTMWQLQRDLLDVRMTLLGGLAVASVLAVILEGSLRAGCATAAFVCAFGSALLERYLFFTASDAPRMPGGITA